MASADDNNPLTQPDRVAFAGDWHGNPTWAVRAIEHAHTKLADRIVHLGDFGYLFYPRFVRPVERTLEELGMHLLFVDGNHDNHQMLAGLPVWPSGLRAVGAANRIWWMPRGFRWEWHGLRWLALGGAHSVDGGVRRRSGQSWWPQERITPVQAEAAIAGGPADIMVTHDCPDGVDIPGLDESATWFDPAEIVRSEEHRTIVGAVVREVRPAWLWHGHYHRRHTTQADLGGWQMTVTGLDCDGGSLTDNLQVVDLASLRIPEGTR